jgi:hypothetical protein
MDVTFDVADRVIDDVPLVVVTEAAIPAPLIPTLAENCRFGCFSLHSHMRRVAMNRGSVRPQVGQCTPSGQRRSTIVRSAVSGSAKYRMASMRVCGSESEHRVIHIGRCDALGRSPVEKPRQLKT